MLQQHPTGLSHDRLQRGANLRATGLAHHEHSQHRPSFGLSPGWMFQLESPSLLHCLTYHVTLSDSS